jgi:hypothetical protein
MAFAPVEDRAVVADFDGGAITSNAGALLLGVQRHSGPTAPASLKLGHQMELRFLSDNVLYRLRPAAGAR